MCMENLQENKAKVCVIESSKSEVVVHENTELFENMLNEVTKHLEVDQEGQSNYPWV